MNSNDLWLTIPERLPAVIKKTRSATSLVAMSYQRLRKQATARTGTNKVFQYARRMTRHIGLRVTGAFHRRIRAAALTRAMPISEFVESATLAAVIEVERRPGTRSGTIEMLLAGARNGQPGYKGCGAAFAQWLLAEHRTQLQGLHEMLAVVDFEMLRREKYKPLFVWCRKHFKALSDGIPPKRRRLFAEAFLDVIVSSRGTKLKGR